MYREFIKTLYIFQQFGVQIEPRAARKRRESLQGRAQDVHVREEAPRLGRVAGAGVLLRNNSHRLLRYGHDASLGFLVGDYVVTLGIAVPGLTIYILRQYTERSIRRGNAKVFSKTAKLGLVSISWFVLVIVVILLVV